MYLYKDYQLIGETLMKINVDDRKHLLHSRGSVPCIDIELWNIHQNKIKELYIRSTKDNFNKYKTKINYGFGEQYILSPKQWKGKPNATQQKLI